MSTMARLARYPLVERLAYYLARARAWWRRTTVSGLAIRAAVWATGLAAILLALPPVVPAGPAAPLAAMLCLLPAGMPQGRAVSILLAGVIALLASGLLAEDGPSLARVGLVAGMLYLHHSTAALAAQIRTDTVVPLLVVRYWMTRAGIVLLATAVLVGFASALPAVGWSATAHIGLGVLAGLGIAVALLWPLRQRR